MIFVPITGTITKKIEIPLDKEGQEEELFVAFAGKGDDLIDLDLSAVHTAPSTRGRITVRGVLRDQATAKIRGLIKIEKTAQKSNDFLEERTILIGYGAKVEAFPYLEIEADDVHASHAATTGMVDGEQLFYLKSRGLSENEAITLLVSGFLDGTVAKKLKKRLRSKLEEVKAYALG